ncbi:MAG: DUF371 domain-containing protein [Nanoarchaeota archaeon]
MKLLDTIEATGHKNVLCNHTSTIELTKEGNLTRKGDCILGVNATKACIDLNKKLVEAIHNQEKIIVQISCGELYDSFYGYGNERLQLSDINEIVFRTSNYICGRTILINCSKSAADLNRDLIKRLRNKRNKLQVNLLNLKDHERK